MILPAGSLLDPHRDAAVVGQKPIQLLDFSFLFCPENFLGGNVLTSQRLVDVILRAFGACAASQVSILSYLNHEKL